MEFDSEVTVLSLRERLARKRGISVPSDQDDDVDCCTICMEELKNLNTGTIDSCKHLFCFECIQQWSKVNNRCPLCQQRFHKISASRTPEKVGKNGKRLRGNKVVKVKNKGRRSSYDDSSAGTSGESVTEGEVDEWMDNVDVHIISHNGPVLRSRRRLRQPRQTRSRRTQRRRVALRRDPVAAEVVSLESDDDEDLLLAQYQTLIDAENRQYNATTRSISSSDTAHNLPTQSATRRRRQSVVLLSDTEDEWTSPPVQSAPITVEVDDDVSPCSPHAISLRERLARNRRRE